VPHAGGERRQSEDPAETAAVGRPLAERRLVARVAGERRGDEAQNEAEADSAAERRPKLCKQIGEHRHRVVHATRLTTPRRRRHPQRTRHSRRHTEQETSADRETELERLPTGRWSAPLALRAAGFAGRGKPSVLALIGAA
jgi:hypothetical protein